VVGEWGASHASGFFFLITGLISRSQAIVVAVNADDPAEINIEAMADFVISLALSRAVSWRTSLRSRRDGVSS
jgi:hypothetical protein